MDILLALAVPFLVMVIVTRITFSLIGATIVTAMLLFVIGTHEEPVWIMFLTIGSFIGGFIVAKKNLKQKQGM